MLLLLCMNRPPGRQILHAFVGRLHSYSDKSAKAKRCPHHCTREANSCYGWAIKELSHVVSGLWDLSLLSLGPHVIIPYNPHHHGIIIYTYLQQIASTKMLPAVLSLVEKPTLKGNAMGQLMVGLYTIAHTSTTPTSSDTL